jgi:hypothetical protein
MGVRFRRWVSAGFLVGALALAGCPDDVTFVPRVDSDEDGVAAEDGDCDDLDATVHPGAEEVCDGQDNDCDGLSDEGFDLDGDGATVCGSDTAAPDCDDARSDVYPGAVEVCNGIDDDCDTYIDQAAVDAPTWYYDGDGDGYGKAGSPLTGCDAPDRYVADATDCDDLHAQTHPGATEICDGQDNDCDDVIDEDLPRTDYYPDTDDDGYGDADAPATSACAATTGMVTDNRDCDDTDPRVNTRATELCDGIDNNCDGQVDEPDAADAGTWYPDEDGDTWGVDGQAARDCVQPEETAARGGDCDDQDEGVNPDAVEMCDSVDNDCDGQIDEQLLTVFYPDGDGDGYGAGTGTPACTAPAGYSAASGDCDDKDKTTYPGALETCNERDDDCDGQSDEGVTKTYYADADADGYGNPDNTKQACTQPAGYTTSSTDCSDVSASVHPGATEVCNGVDEDCDSLKDENVCCTYTVTWTKWKVTDVWPDPRYSYADVAASITANGETYYDPPPYGNSYANAQAGATYTLNEVLGDPVTVTAGTSIQVPASFIAYEWDTFEEDDQNASTTLKFTCSGSGNTQGTITAEVAANFTGQATVVVSWATK